MSGRRQPRAAIGQRLEWRLELACIAAIVPLVRDSAALERGQPASAGAPAGPATLDASIRVSTPDLG